MGTVADVLAVELQRLQAEGKLEIVGQLKIYRYGFNSPRGERYGLKIWRGKAKRPYCNYYYETPGSREQAVCREIASAKASDDLKATRRSVESAKVAEMRQALHVGSLLHYSWGWEQTNCDFFQVVDRKESTVWIREIGCRIVEGSGGGSSMSDRRMPSRDCFIGDEILKKRINAYGVTMPFGIASPCGENEAFYCSWYA